MSGYFAPTIAPASDVKTQRRRDADDTQNATSGPILLLLRLDTDASGPRPGFLRLASANVWFASEKSASFPSLFGRIGVELVLFRVFPGFFSPDFLPTSFFGSVFVCL